MKNFWILIMTFILTACGQDNDAQNNLIESEAYLKNNLSNQGVIAVKPGLQYVDYEVGLRKDTSFKRYDNGRFPWNIERWICILEFY